MIKLLIYQNKESIYIDFTATINAAKWGAELAEIVIFLLRNTKY